MRIMENRKPQNIIHNKSRKMNIKKYVSITVCVLSTWSCKCTQKVDNWSPVYLFNLRQNSKVSTFTEGYIGVGFFNFKCPEYDGYLSTTLSLFGVKVKNYKNDTYKIYEYLRSPNGPAKAKFGDDTIRYVCSHDYQTSFRVKKYNIYIRNQDTIDFIPYQDTVAIVSAQADTIKLKCEDSLKFTYADYDYTIYRFTGELDNGQFGTFFLSNYFGVFKEYLPNEIDNCQLDNLYNDQSFDIYYAHLYYMFHNPNFHTRSDNGPLFLFKSSYIKSDKLPCNNNTWPTSGWGMK